MCYLKGFFSFLINPSGKLIAMGGLILALCLPTLTAHANIISDEGLLIEVLGLTSGNRQNNAIFGQWVKIDGDHAFVGAPSEIHTTTERGAVYYYRRLNDQWVLQQRLVPPGTNNDWFFGISIDIQGDQLAVGAMGFSIAPRNHAGMVYLYTYNDVSQLWVLQQTLTAPDAPDPIPQGGGLRFGSGLNFHNDTLIVGAILANQTGTVYFFNYDTNTSTWVFDQQVTTPDGDVIDFFGISVAISGDHMLVGASGGTAPDFIGAVYHFRQIADVWQYVATYTLTEPFAQFGDGVIMHDDWALVSAPQLSRIYFYRLENDIYVQETVINTPNPLSFSFFGLAMVYQDDLLLVGAPYQGLEVGMIYAYTYSARDGWVYRDRFVNGDNTPSQRFGYEIDISGDQVLVSAPIKNNGSGVAYIIRLEPDFNTTPAAQQIDLVGLPGDTASSNLTIQNNGLPGSTLNVEVLSITEGYSVSGLPLSSIAPGTGFAVNVQCDRVSATPAVGTMVLRTNESGSPLYFYNLTCNSNLTAIQPGDYDLIAPADASETVSVDRLNPIIWSALPSATHYTLVVSLTSTNARYGTVINETWDADDICTGGLCQVALSSVQLGVLIPGQYSWTVLAVSGANGFEAQNGPFTLYVESPDAYGIVRNGGFEAIDTDGKPVLGAWNPKNFTAGDKIHCNRLDHPTKPDRITASEGNCAFRFKGAPAKRSQIVQNWRGMMIPTIDAGDNMVLSAMIDANHPADRVVIVTLTYSDFSKAKMYLRVDAPTDGYESFMADLQTSNPVEQVKIVVRYRGTVGRLLIDDLRLVVESLAGGDQPSTAGDLLPSVEILIPLPLPPAETD